MTSGCSAAMSARSNGRRSSQRSARLRMLRVATSRRSNGASGGGWGSGHGRGRLGRRQAAVTRLGVVQGWRVRGAVATCGGWRARPERELEQEGGALAQLGFGPDAAAMALDDMASDGKAEPGAAPSDTGPVDLVEALEDARAVRLRDPHPVVGHRREGIVPVAPHRYPDLATFGTELHRVVDQVDEHLPQPGLVAADGRHAGL